MTQPSPSYDQSVAFLKKWLPTGPWVLTAIGLDRTGIETRTFRPAEEQELRKWLEQQGSHRNVYFSVNPPTRDLTKKAERTDILELAWLHVDIDPRAGEDVAAEQARALSLLTNPPGGVPKPTVIVFSGGGYQGFWRLREPIAINGDLNAAEDAKRWNLQLELLFGADNCHNVDRIMRLPGTINRPDSKKRAKGRREAVAQVVAWDESLVYDVAQFTKAPQVQTAGATDVGSVGTTQRVRVSGNVKRYNGDIHIVPTASGRSISDKGKVVIVQGHDPDEPNKYGSSRSEWLFFACCEMVRAGVTDDDIYAVITDPQFGISASVLDKGSGIEKYALRQIERAKEEAVDPWLRKLNEQHAVIANWNGKTRVIEEQLDEALGRYRVTKQSFDDFRNRYMHIQVEIGRTDKGVPINKPLGQWWLQHEQRRQYNKIVFAPGREVPDAYNLWRGFACDAKPGDCSLFLEHLKNNVCRGNEEYYRYLVGWMARAVQAPDSPGYSAVVMRGGMGTGKSFVAKTFGSLFGRHYLQVTDPKHLVGSFNSHLRDCVVLFGDEAFYAGDKKHESMLKTLITEELLTVEAKGVDAEAAANCVHLIMASNETWVVPAGFDDRRFFVLDISDEKRENHSYFEGISRQMSSGGREALLHFLLTYDVKTFNVRKVPKTEALQQQKLLSMDPEEDWWYSKLREGKLLIEDENWRREIPTQDLLTDFLVYCRQFNVPRRGNGSKLADSLKRFMPQGFEVRQGRNAVQVNMPDGTQKMVNRPYWYTLPTLEACRDHWDTYFGGPYPWPKHAERVESGASSQPPSF